MKQQFTVATPTGWSVRTLPGTATGAVQHGESTHPEDSGIRSVTSLLTAYPDVDTAGTRAVRRREKRRVSPFFAGDEPVAERRHRRFTAAAPAALGGVA